MNSRAKGVRGELEAAKWWQAHGCADCIRGQQHKGGPDSPDIVNIPKLHVEVKRRAKIANFAEWLAQAKLEAPEGKRPVVMARADNGQWMFVLDEETFLALYDGLLHVE